MSCRVFDTRRITYVSVQQALPVHLCDIYYLEKLCQRRWKWAEAVC
jgi:hypothetical protein